MRRRLVFVGVEDSVGVVETDSVDVVETTWSEEMMRGTVIETVLPTTLVDTIEPRCALNLSAISAIRPNRLLTELIVTYVLSLTSAAVFRALRGYITVLLNDVEPKGEVV